MAAANQTLSAIRNISGVTELRDRLLFVLFALFIYRLFTHVPVPGINPIALASFIEQSRGTILDVFNLFSGGALERSSVCALNVIPYITASIIMNMYTALDPNLKQMRREGEAGRRRITRYTRYLTVALAIFQAYAVSYGLETQQGVGGQPIVINPGYGFRITATISLVTGTMFLVWLGEQITERGIGNGISMIIFAGIVAGLPAALFGTFELARTGELSILILTGLLALIVVVTAFVVFMEMSQRRIPVNYPRQQMAGGRSNYLPLKINMAGVIPPIFASSLILFPSTIARVFDDGSGGLWLRNLQTALQPGTFLYILLFSLGIFFFCFFYTTLMFDSKDIADNLKRSSTVIPGIRPGEQTARYLDTVMGRLTLVGACYIVLVCLLPELLILNLSVPFYFGGTSLLIVVVVVIDFMSQMQTHLVSRQYEGLMRKANLSGSRRRS